VLLGSHSCDKVGGGLVLGRVTDANTGAGVNGATVTSVDVPADSATSAAAPGDPNLGDGFYRLFSSATGSHAFTATRRAYATVSLAEQPGNFQILARGGAAPQTVKTKVTPLSLAAAAKLASPATAAPADVNPSAAPWTSIANYPVPVQDNLVDVFGGKVYSAYGWSGSETLADLYAYDPDTGAWTKLARAADVREAPAGGFISDRLYATGGWGADGQPDPKTEAYDPDTNTWTAVPTTRSRQPGPGRRR
jgi:hypothetical protein